MRTRFAPVASLVACALASAAAVGEEAEFTIDPAVSFFTAGGSIAGRTLGAQSPGSDRTGVSGPIVVDIDRAANTVSIVSEFATLLPQPLPHRPGWNTSEPSPSTFGLVAGPAADPLFANVTSLRPEIGLDDVPLNGGAPRLPEHGYFWVGDGSIWFTIGDSSSAYVDLHGKGNFQTSVEPVTLTLAGDVETLTIPLRVSVPIPYEPDDIRLDLTAHLVATRIVPEPTAAAGVMAVAPVILRRRRGK